MRTVAFIPVRLTSSRLPRKHLRTIGDRSLLSWVLYRLKEAKYIDDIVVCLPDEPESSDVASICDVENVHYYIYPGDVNDVVGRLTTAANKYNAEICVLASGDCPLLNSTSIDKLILALSISDGADMAFFSEHDGVQSIHEGILVTTRAVWEQADILSTTRELREHQFPVIFQFPEKFSRYKSITIQDDEIYYRVHHRISVDTPADLIFQNRLYYDLKVQNKEYNLGNAIEVLEFNPELLEDNRNVLQKGVDDKTYRVAFIGDSIDDYQNKCNVPSIEIADKLIHEEGCGAEFYVFEKAAANILDSYHFSSKLMDEVMPADIEKFDIYDLLIVNRNKKNDFPALFNEGIKSQADKVVYLDEFSLDVSLKNWIQARNELRK